MSRSEFIVVTVIVIFLAIAFGWFAHWLVHRFIRVNGSEMDQIDWMAKALHEAEEQRDREAEQSKRREAELVGKLNGARAEASAAMDSLRDLRRESDELRAYIERIHQSE